MKLSRLQIGVFALSAGFALGAGGVWTWLQNRPTSTGSTATSFPVNSTRPAALPTLVPPPPLPPLEASEAIAAWLALGAPSDGSASAPHAVQEAALRALLIRLTDADFPRLLGPLFARSGPDAQSLRQTVVGLWLHRHPAAIAAWVLTADLPAEGQTRYHLARQTGMYWAGRDLPAAIAWAEKIPDPALSAGVLEIILPNLAATDPERAIALARAQGEEFWAKLRDPLFEQWAGKDPAAALRRFGREQIERENFNFRVMDALGRWFARDLDAGLAWLTEEGSLDSNQRNNLLRNAFSHAIHSSENVGALATALADRSDLHDRTNALNGLLLSWYNKDAAAARAWLASLPDPATKADLQEALVPSAWREHMQNPQGFLPFALDMPPGKQRDQRLGLLVSVWAKTDPAAAAAWLEQQEARDPSLAAVGDRLEGGLVAALAATDPLAARARYDTLPPGEARLAAAPEIALAWAKTDPAAASRWLAQQFPTIDAATAQNLPQFATYGLNHTTSDSLQRSVQIFAATVRAWMTSEPQATLDWVEALPDPVQRQLALTSIASSASDDLGQAAPLPTERRADLLATLRQPAEREAALGSLLSNWLHQDEVAALAWLESQDVLTPPTKAKLIEWNNRGR